MRHDGLELRGGEDAGVAEVLKFGAAGGEGAVDGGGVGHVWKMRLGVEKGFGYERRLPRVLRIGIDGSKKDQETCSIASYMRKYRIWHSRRSKGPIDDNAGAGISQEK